MIRGYQYNKKDQCTALWEWFQTLSSCIVIVWRQVASHQITCAATSRSKVVAQRFRVLPAQPTITLLFCFVCVLGLAKRVGARLLLASTSEVYGGKKDFWSRFCFPLPLWAFRTPDVIYCSFLWSILHLSLKRSLGFNHSKSSRLNKPGC